MPEIVDLVVPALGESVSTAFVGRWMVPVGGRVEQGDPVLELDSDKASMELPAPASGVLVEQLVPEGEEVAVGSVLGRIDTGAVAAEAAPAGSGAASPSPPPTPPEGMGMVRAGPAARAAATAEGVDLARVVGTGPRGRITRRDVEAAAGRASASGQPDDPAGGGGALPLDEPEETVVPMTPIRRTIARRLVAATREAAMLTTFNEVDMGEVMALRQAWKERFLEKHGVKLGFMSFFVKAVVEALKAWPALNAEVRGTDIVYKRAFHIGVAVATERGLVVPVLRHADRLSFAEVEKGIGELASQVREGRIAPQDLSGGTFTISNGGVFGSLMSTPILNPPQVGVLGMHAIQRRPVEREGAIVLRPMMYLALTYDHRIVDGREAVQFLVRVKELVEDPVRLLLEI